MDVRLYYVQHIIINAIRWAKPNGIAYEITNQCPHLKAKVTDEFDEYKRALKFVRI